METVESLRKKFNTLGELLNERTKRVWAAMEARNAGWGGVTLVHNATGISRSTINHGLRELKAGRAGSARNDRLRRSGGGRKKITEADQGILDRLEKLVEAGTLGDPQAPLRWSSKSTRKLAQELGAEGHDVSDRTVAALLHRLNYSLQGNYKTKEGSSHPDRNAQFEYINAQVTRFQTKGQPVISVDPKRKELIGDFRNSGKEWSPKGEPEEVQVHDFEYKDLGKGIPYGVYDMTGNRGWVSVGTDHDTAEFAVETIRRWWLKMGRKDYPNATDLLITADSGGSNANRSKLWKVELSELATETGLRISISHLPPGTSKWNKIEHRMFSHITMNWRGRPLLSHQVMVNLIANTTTSRGLRIKAGLDTGLYPAGVVVSKSELSAVRLKAHSFHEEWNYTILP